MRNFIKEKIKAAQEGMRKYSYREVANKEPKLKVHDWVMINVKNIKTIRLTKMVDYKLRGKFEIEKLIGTCAHELKLALIAGKIYPVFYIKLLQPYYSNMIPRRHSPTPPPMDLEEQEWFVDATGVLL